MHGGVRYYRIGALRSIRILQGGSSVYIFPWSASLGPLPCGRVAVRDQAFPLFDRSLDDGVVRAA